MLIKIRSSRLFTTDPARRFAEEYGVAQTLWAELWKRYKLLEYTIEDLADYFQMKAGRQIRRRSIKRWVMLSEVYAMSKTARESGAKVINTQMFGSLEQHVIYEVTRHMKSGNTHNSRIMA